MFVGTTVFKLDGTPFPTPEFPRGGLAATFAADVMNLDGSPTVAIHIQHRNSEDTSFTTLSSFAAITTTGEKQIDVTGLKEIVRLLLEFDAGDQSSDAIHLLIQAPSWRPF